MTPDSKSETPQRVGPVAPWFGRFEVQSLYSAHIAEAEKLEKHAADRREWAKERGPIWQKYLAAAIKLEGLARKHRERAKEILMPNSAISHEPFERITKI